MEMRAGIKGNAENLTRGYRFRDWCTCVVLFKDISVAYRNSNCGCSSKLLSWLGLCWAAGPRLMQFARLLLGTELTCWAC